MHTDLIRNRTVIIGKDKAYKSRYTYVDCSRLAVFVNEYKTAYHKEGKYHSENFTQLRCNM